MRERPPDRRQLGHPEPAAAVRARHERARDAERDELAQHRVREVVGAVPRLDLGQHGVAHEGARLLREPVRRGAVWRAAAAAHATVTGTRWTDVFA